MSNYIEGILTLWYLLTTGSMVFLLWDFYTNTPAGRVMKLAWVLVILYTGPIGLFIYLLSCRQPLPNMHDAFIAIHWKQAIGSLLHCVAGDATGIILSAIIVYHFGLPNGIDLLIEYTSAFIVGWLIFQALFMRSMFGGSYWRAVGKTFFAETVSMNMVMVGMIPTMVVLMHALPDANNPYHLLFWGVMSVATIAGMITAYPINSWMVAKGLKHGMMSAIPAPKMRNNSISKSSKDDMNDMPMEHANHSLATSIQSTIVLIGTFSLLIISLLITTIFVPITFMSIS